MFDWPWQILDYQWLMKLSVESNDAKRQKLKAKKKWNGINEIFVWVENCEYVKGEAKKSSIQTQI